MSTSDNVITVEGDAVLAMERLREQLAEANARVMEATRVAEEAAKKAGEQEERNGQLTALLERASQRREGPESTIVGSSARGAVGVTAEGEQGNLTPQALPIVRDLFNAAGVTPANATNPPGGLTTTIAKTIQEEVQRAMREISSSMEAKMGYVASQVHKATSAAPEIDRLVKEARVTPFSAKIRGVELGELPKVRLSQYRGTSDPNTHVKSFRIATERVGGEETKLEAILCHLFVESLQGPASDWFAKLPSESIGDSDELVTCFLRHYSMYVQNEATVTTLWNLSQGREETLRQYVGRFKDVMVKIQGLDSVVAIQALKHGLWYLAPFREELIKMRPLAIEDALHRATLFMEIEEETLAQRKIHEGGSKGRQHGKREGGDGGDAPSSRARKGEEDRRNPDERRGREAPRQEVYHVDERKDRDYDRRDRYQGGSSEDRGRFPDYRGGSSESRGRFSDDRGGPSENRGRYPDDRGGFSGDRERYPDDRGGYPGNQGGFSNDQGRSSGNQGGSSRSGGRGGFSGGRGGFSGGRGGFGLKFWPKDMSKFCDYHNYNGHATEDCAMLKKELQRRYATGDFGDFAYKPPVPWNNGNRAWQGRQEEPTNDGKGDRDGAKRNLAIEPPPARHSEEDRPASRTRIEVIMGGSRFCEDSVNSIKAFQRRGKEHGQEDVKMGAAGARIEFVENEDCADMHDDALVLELSVGGCEVCRILVDNGSSVDVIFYECLTKMGIEGLAIGGRPRKVSGFNGDVAVSMGTVHLPVRAGSINRMTEFMVLNVPSHFNIILGRPWIHSMRAVPSTYHQSIKFPGRREGEVEELKGSRDAYRICYMMHHKSMTAEKGTTQTEKGEPAGL